MSDTPAEAGVPEATGPGDVGGGAPAEATPEPSHEYLDPDAYSGHHVRIKADGEELDVPLSEVLQGYSRTADYTRKTQTLAEQQREAQFGLTLQKALENNPEQTLRILQEQYGIQLGAPAPAADSDDDSWLDDPVEQKLKLYDQKFEQIEQQRADQELRVAVRVLQQRYGEDFNPQAVVNAAAATGRMDLEAIHKEMMFDKYWAQQQAAQKRQAEDAARTAAKAGLTTHGGSSANGAMTEQPTGSSTSIADAYYEAKRALGQ